MNIPFCEGDISVPANGQQRLICSTGWESTEYSTSSGSGYQKMSQDDFYEIAPYVVGTFVLVFAFRAVFSTINVRN